MVIDERTYVVLFNYTKALMVALGRRDLLTRLHSERVLGLSEDIALSCGLSMKELGTIKIAASFHDIGKIGIPDYILFKSGKHNNIEWEKMKEHSLFGEEIMSATDLEGSLDASLLIRNHHEHFDGNGYPDGLAGEDIPLGARIISIADSYDAMAVTRSYHSARTHSQILEILHLETGLKHDPDLMHKFLNIIESSKYRAAAN